MQMNGSGNGARNGIPFSARESNCLENRIKHDRISNGETVSLKLRSQNETLNRKTNTLTVTLRISAPNAYYKFRIKQQGCFPEGGAYLIFSKSWSAGHLFFNITFTQQTE